MRTGVEMVYVKVFAGKGKKIFFGKDCVGNGKRIVEVN